MSYIIKILCVLVLLVTTLFSKTVYMTYSDEFELTTQYNTGVYWRDNCGAASLYMCLDYMDIELGSVVDIRKNIKDSSGWLYTDELEEFLNNNNIEYSTRYIWGRDTIIKELDSGVLMLCVDASKISGKDYSNVTGHFIVVVGYVQNDRGCKLEVYDPMGREIKYYDLDDVFTATESWWRWMFVFRK